MNTPKYNFHFNELQEGRSSDFWVHIQGMNVFCNWVESLFLFLRSLESIDSCAQWKAHPTMLLFMGNYVFYLEISRSLLFMLLSRFSIRLVFHSKKLSLLLYLASMKLETFHFVPKCFRHTTTLPPRSPRPRPP